MLRLHNRLLLRLLRLHKQLQDTPEAPSAQNATKFLAKCLIAGKN